MAPESEMTLELIQLMRIEEALLICDISVEWHLINLDNLEASYFVYKEKSAEERIEEVC